jgi:hypothetical protein
MPEPTSEWQGFFQGLAVLGTVISAVVAGWFGTKKAAKPEDDIAEQIRLDLASALAKANDYKAALAEARMRADWKAALEATRLSMQGQIEHVIEKVEEERKELERRVLDLERHRSD